MRIASIIAYILVIVGAINWFLIGVFDLNLVSLIFAGRAYFVSRIIYILVGLSGLWLILYSIVKHPLEERVSSTH